MQTPVIRVIGVGNGGCNAVTQILASEVHGVELVAMDTDARKLRSCPVPKKVSLGPELTNGLGAGGNPEAGLKAAEHSRREIEEALAGAHMVFVTAAMGGGTGTGAAPLISKMAKDNGALTVAVCTKPFRFERQRRMDTALRGIEQMSQNVDAIITIDNQKLFDQVDKSTRLTEAFALADDVLRQAVQGVSDLITIPGTINVDFADVRSVLEDAGPVLMGIAAGNAETPAADLVAKCVASPLLENGIKGATNILLNVTIGPDTSLWQVHELADAVAEATETEAPNVIFGTVVDDNMAGRVSLTIVAAAFAAQHAGRRPADTYPSPSAARPTYNPPPATTPSYTPPSPPAAEEPAPRRGGLPDLPPPPPGRVDDDDLDMPTFLRRDRRRGRGDGDGQ